MVAGFEEKWRETFGYKHARAMSSGTAALTACCMALYDFAPDDDNEIICPALSFIATANAIRAAGYTPKFVDVKLETMNIDEDKIEEAIGPQTAGIVVVNLMGKPAELKKIWNLAESLGLYVICDNCEGYGCTHHGKYSLEYADMEVSSHYAAHLICCGEGGVASTNNDLIDESLESIRNHGREAGSDYFDHARWGMNFKMSDLHAAVALGGIEDFWKVFERRCLNVFYLRECMRGLEDKAWFKEEEPHDVNCPHAFSITLKPPYKDRIGDFQKWLDIASIHWKRNFGCIPKHEAFAYREWGSFPNAEYIGDHGIHVGCHQYLSDGDLEYLGGTIKKFLEEI
jgi:dTDP-4-amino-4,6-dideoxygalactose transaminase